MNLLPYPRSLTRRSGTYTLPLHAVLHLPAELPRDTVMLPIAERLQSAAAEAGVNLELITGPANHPRRSIWAVPSSSSSLAAPKLLSEGWFSSSTSGAPDAYSLAIGPKGIVIEFSHPSGLRPAVATLRQLLREFGRRLPCLTIRDYPDFPRRGVMLDISRGRVPSLQTLFELTDHLADFKINEFQLYTEHTFAYRNYEPVWRGWGPLTGDDILQLDAHCRRLGIELVPNQNSFGHLRYWLEYPPLKRLAETSQPYEGSDGTFLRFPATLAPTNPGTLPFLRELYDELLPHFTSPRFNVGCDETWDLGLGQSKGACAAKGKGRVYVDFLNKIHKEVTTRGRQMMFWGDIVLHYPELLKEIPKDTVALNWGYEANHPFERETALFAESGIPFYVCPGTSTWMTLIGRHDNGFANLRHGALAGRRQGALGYLNTDWGDGGHPQPLAVSYLPYLLGAALSWCAKTADESLLVPVLSRDIFHDPTHCLAKAALGLGMAHLKFKYTAPNVTPFGAVIAAPRPETRELFCRDGLKYYARIPATNIRAALAEVEKQRALASASCPGTRSGEILALELDVAAWMAAQSCKIMLWQQALAAGHTTHARQMARSGIRQLQDLDRDFRANWPLRNKGTTARSSPFLQWRIKDYQRGILHFPPEVARVAKPRTYAAE